MQYNRKIAQQNLIKNTNLKVYYCQYIIYTSLINKTKLVFIWPSIIFCLRLKFISVSLRLKYKFYID